ncbi:hypothetical protein [Streptomyces amakusaensis]|uniref:Uncharacterized protein n=1 Tax=Streptomyces amakusaensis TaxID=67271 RepID=A0ABW0AJW7_9ACTN
MAIVEARLVAARRRQKAADTARTRTAQHLLTARLEQLREQPPPRPSRWPCRGRTGWPTSPPAPWMTTPEQ